MTVGGDTLGESVGILGSTVRADDGGEVDELDTLRMVPEILSGLNDVCRDHEDTIIAFGKCSHDFDSSLMGIFDIRPPEELVKDDDKPSYPIDLIRHLSETAHLGIEVTEAHVHIVGQVDRGVHPGMDTELHLLCRHGKSHVCQEYDRAE